MQCTSVAGAGRSVEGEEVCEVTCGLFSVV
jgi:hypothetical protein